MKRKYRIQLALTPHTIHHGEKRRLLTLSGHSDLVKARDSTELGLTDFEWPLRSIVFVFVDIFLVKLNLSYIYYNFKLFDGCLRYLNS